jgi:dihydrofolate reductase
MSKVRVACFSLSIDGYGAGPDQSLENPLGRGGEALHEWFFPTRTFRAMQGEAGGTTGIDEDFAALSFDNVGAWILGRNMFGPMRGPWPDESWRGWWGDSPPYHVPAFVLTHHPRPPLAMEGGTTFHFVTGGIGEALERAREAAAGRDVRIGGGVATLRQYAEARLIDELHLAVSPILLGRGESLFEGLDWTALGYRVTGHRAGEGATHFMLGRDG